MKRLCKSSDKSAIELSEDITIQILHRLPSKSVARFASVCKQWWKCIVDPSLDYSCRSQRWSPHPYMMGFFCQARGIVGPENIHFFFSSKKSSEVIDGSLDESVNFLGRELYIIASSNGFILSAEAIRYQKLYYVYNPATRQHVALLIPRASCMKLAAIGFHCKVDDTEKDVISFTIVRYALPWLDFRSSVTIESFSSQTDVWTTIDLTLDVPLRIPLSSWRKVTSAGVIDGVFCWIDEESQIILYDSVDRCFWALQLTQEMKAAGDCYLGVSGGALYYASCVAAKITVWCLESTIRSRDEVLWIRKYAANLTYTLVKYCPGGLGADVKTVNVHPANPHIYYLYMNGRVISYDLEENIAEILYDIGEGDYLFFPYEWHQWPRLLKDYQEAEV